MLLAVNRPLGSSDDTVGDRGGLRFLLVPGRGGGPKVQSRAPTCCPLTRPGAAAAAPSCEGHRRTAASWGAASPPRASLRTPHCRC